MKGMEEWGIGGEIVGLIGEELLGCVFLIESVLDSSL